MINVNKNNSIFEVQRRISDGITFTQFTQDKEGAIGESRSFEDSSLFLQPLRLSNLQNSDKMQNEKWLDVPGYEGLYRVSNFGEVLGLKRGKLKQSISQAGYYYVALCKNNNPKAFKVHRLVAMAFIPNPENKPQVNHIDSNPLNNHVENLEWVTSKENTWHSIRSNRKRMKLNKETALNIRNCKLSTSKIMKMFGVSETTVLDIKNKKSWRV